MSFTIIGKNLCFVLLMLMATTSFSQYHRLAKEGRVWYTEVNSTFLGTSTTVLAVEGDTLINGNTYPLLLEKNSALTTLKKLGYFMEDSLAGTVMIHYLDGSTPHTWYDMSVAAGDTIAYTSITGGTGQARVDSVYMVTDLHSLSRKAIVLGPLHPDSCISTWQQTWIEGLGSTGLLTQPLPPCEVTTEVEYTLNCVWDNGVKTYGATTQCFVLSSQEEKLLPLAVYPNPSSGTFTIEIPEGNTGNLHMEVYNTTGELIYTAPVKYPQTRLELKNAGPGLYLLSVVGNNAVHHLEKIFIE